MRSQMSPPPLTLLRGGSLSSPRTAALGQVDERATQREGEPGPAGRTAQVIAVTSGKGGVGKTSVAGNLAVALSQRGQRVLLIDGDLGIGDMNLLFGLTPRLTLRDVLSGERSVSEVITAGPAGVSLLPGCAASFRMANLSAEDRDRVFAAIGPLCGGYDVIVVDTGAGLSATGMHFAAAADQPLLVVTPEPASIADAYAVAKVLSSHHHVRRLWVLPNQVLGVREADEVFRCLATLVGRFLELSLVLAGHLPKDRNVSNAERSGTPFQLLTPQAPAAQGLRRVAQRLLRAASLPPGGEVPRLVWRPSLRPEGVPMPGRPLEAEGGAP